MREHFLASESDGSLYDTRVPDWSARPPLRAVFDRHYRTIKTAAEFKATLRAGPFAWPGGYPLYFVMSDGESMSFESARENMREIISAIAARDNSGWRPIGVEINYEDSEMVCCHSGRPIESAYGGE